VTEVLGFDLASQTYLIQDLFVRRYSSDGHDNRVQSSLLPTGVLPSCRAQLDEHGVRLPEQMLRVAASSAAKKDVDDGAQ
jgi:pilus assembly protein CpaF